MNYGLINIFSHHEILISVIEKCYGDLVSFVKEISSRYAFQALGTLLMENNAIITEEVRTLILKNSHWRHERYKFKIKQERIKRKKDLFDFQAKILEYKEGN